MVVCDRDYGAPRGKRKLRPASDWASPLGRIQLVGRVVHIVIQQSRLENTFAWKRGKLSMANTLQQRISKIRLRAARAVLALAVVLGVGLVVTRSAQAQAFSILYNFTGLQMGQIPTDS
jgi:hypothetical protein